MSLQHLSRMTLLLVLAVGGCNRSPGAADPAAAGRSAESYKRRPVEDLPAVGDYLPPLDDGRVEIAPPRGWTTLQRSSRFLAGFAKGKASELPRITVTVAAPAAASTADTTEQGVAQLADELDGLLLKDSKKQVPERCLPIILGETPFVRHVRLATSGGNPVVIQSLQTVQGGRLYTVELICDVNAADRREYKASLTKFRDYGYAVAANMKFGTPASPPADSATPSDAPEAAAAPAADPAAETKPAPAENTMP